MGREGLVFLRRLIDGTAKGWRLESASFTSLELQFALIDGATHLELAAVPRLGRSHNGGAVGIDIRQLNRPGRPTPAESGILAAITAGFARIDFVALISRLGRDSLLYCDPRGNQGPSRQDSYYERCDHTPDFWKFFYPQHPFLDSQARLGERCARIHHGTRECEVMTPNVSVAALRYFADEVAQDPGEGDVYLSTGITEADVLAGRTQDLLGRTLDRVAREHRPVAIHLRTTCLPELIGDNPAAFIKSIESRLGIPVFWTSKTRPSASACEAWLRRSLAKTKFASRRDPRAVLLCGSASQAAQLEAKELCAGLGLRVVGTLLPSLDFRQVPELGEASAVVWWNPIGWEKVGDAAFLDCGFKVVRYHPPFGLAGTKAWLERTASVLGGRGADQVYAEELAARKSRLADIQKELRDRTVALAGDMTDIGYLTSQREMFGFSLAALLCELGCNVRCLVFNGGDGARAARTAQGAGTLEFVPFASRGQLDQELARGADLVFSHFNHDPRLEAHGLRGFTEKDLEVGMDGLLRSGKILSERCAMRPFLGRRGGLKSWL
ncbi:MAG: hypothetical protein A2X37_11305 [Elusimicrobia bacterium GWA2_66_18]|nr:MAG: hypothetical protein A2X37_11305 [Elusimicrobia bacterium GWA2_66_18]